MSYSRKVFYRASVKGINRLGKEQTFWLNSLPVSGCDPVTWADWSGQWADLEEFKADVKRLSVEGFSNWSIRSIDLSTLQCLEVVVVTTTDTSYRVIGLEPTITDEDHPCGCGQRLCSSCN
jgi:hypothetical protein